ncbi:MAG: rRNA pseudouridine synthase [bacterium]|nr:rRNA pseudouridine synthase [bacterium]
MDKERINKYIASCTEYSRRQADKLIEEGKVKVNGNLVTEAGICVSDKDSIEVDGQVLRRLKKEYYLFHKPAGYITTKSDEKNRKTIYDLLPPKMKLLNPAGRLDKASSGLIILTNDGELLQKLTHPKIQVAKVYKVKVRGKFSDGDFYKFQNGIEIEPNKIAYGEIELLDFEDGLSTFQITLYQGYNRQIRKMMAELGKEVVALKRVSHATLSIAGLEKGKFRSIKYSELKNLSVYLNKKINALKKKK